jgi:ComF family protein
MLCESASRLDTAVMPLRCVFCGVDCRRRETAICKPCLAELPLIDAGCHGCARPMKTMTVGKQLCADCQLQPGPFSMARAPLAYDYPVDAAIKMFKFRRRLQYAPAFGALLCKAFSELPADIDALLPVPLHWRRHGHRGFNQAAELCRPLRKSTGLPVIRNVRRRRYTPYQSGLTARERRRNLRDAFAIRGVIERHHVLIIDDVITTGETTRQLASVLLQHGVTEVSVLALARA